MSHFLIIVRTNRAQPVRFRVDCSGFRARAAEMCRSQSAILTQREQDPAMLSSWVMQKLLSRVAQYHCQPHSTDALTFVTNLASCALYLHAPNFVPTNCDAVFIDISFDDDVSQISVLRAGSGAMSTKRYYARRPTNQRKSKPRPARRQVSPNCARRSGSAPQRQREAANKTAISNVRVGERKQTSRRTSPRLDFRLKKKGGMP